MKSQYIKEIFRAFISEDRQKFVEYAQAIISEEKRLNHQLFANELKNILNQLEASNVIHEPDYSKRYKKNIPIPRDNEKGFPLLELKEFDLSWDDIILSAELKARLQDISKGFWTKEVLNSYGLKPKQKILFYGPPGTGKTLTAKMFSCVLGYPLVYVRFDSIVSSYLGETAANLKKIFEFIENGHWVVLLDEFDVVGKQRDDQYEHGEIKRVVNNFMQMLDNFNGESLIIAATNHQHLLDPGLWRRFDDILLFDLPGNEQLEALYRCYFKSLKKNTIDFKKLAEKSDGFSGADISQIVAESIREMVLENGSVLSEDTILKSIEYHRKRKVLEPQRT
jgi:SpoVK/Ycf46/Vps4 family AAA+-type ATPase